MATVKGCMVWTGREGRGTVRGLTYACVGIEPEKTLLIVEKSCLSHTLCSARIFAAIRALCTPLPEKYKVIREPGTVGRILPDRFVMDPPSTHLRYVELKLGGNLDVGAFGIVVVIFLELACTK